MTLVSRGVSRSWKSRHGCDCAAVIMNSCPVLQEAAWQRSRWPLTAAGWCTASAAWRSPPPLCHDTSSSTGWVAGTRGKREGARNVLQCYKWEYQSHWGSLHIFNLVVYLTRTRRWERSKTRRRCSLSSWKKSGVGSGRRHTDVTKCCDCSESVRSNPSSVPDLFSSGQPAHQLSVGQFTEASCFSIWA